MLLFVSLDCVFVPKRHQFRVPLFLARLAFHLASPVTDQFCVACLSISPRARPARTADTDVDSASKGYPSD